MFKQYQTFERDYDKIILKNYHVEKQNSKRMSARELECPGREMITCM